ncbi:Hypothetical predicted protein [Paramuricea clavata]|uniref:Uncharacterized protein n=1 Tax=Paramuricea clavata TaxID=317549 RepID=A0A6S7GGI0_PARCT|nr:Hypothetical predicted protein [Paramuricea clavata]
MHKWLLATDEPGNAIRTVLFDFRQAFDLLDHNRLITTLKSFDLPSSTINWIIDFLIDRKQLVKEQDYEIVTRINKEFNDDAVTNANESGGTSAEGGTSHYEEVEGQSSYETPAQNVTYPETKTSHKNAGYTVFDVNRLRDRNTRDDDTYQKLVKPTSSYVMPQDDRTKPCENMKMEISLPDFTELDQSRRDAENYSAYQTLLKTELCIRRKLL